MYNLVRRFFRVIVQILTLGIVKLEQGTATQRRSAILDEQVQKIAEARKSLGRLVGQGKTQAREVSELESRVKQLQLRKEHHMKLLQSAAEGSVAARDAESRARDYHRQLAEANSDLNAARSVLQTITQEYSAARKLVATADSAVTDAKRRGQRLERRREQAAMRDQLLETTASMQGLGGLGDELSEMDRAMEAEIDGLEGMAFVRAEGLADAMAERELDIQIANGQADDDFERELNTFRSAPATTVDAVREPEPVSIPERTSGSERSMSFESSRTPEPAAVVDDDTPRRSSFGSSDYGSGSFGSSDFGSSSSDCGSSDGGSCD